MLVAFAVSEYPQLAVLMALYVIVLFVSVVGLIGHSRRLAAAAGWILLVAFCANTGVLVHRWIEAQRPPFKTLFETLLFYPWCVALVTIVLLVSYRLHAIVPFSALVNIAGLAYALRRPDVELGQLPPSLQSVWFIPHVALYFVAYAYLFASLTLALLAVILPRWRPPANRAGQRGPDHDRREGRSVRSSERGGFEEYANLAVRFGFCTLTLGLISGAIWANEVGWDYWSWDPKENLALVTFLAYLTYLHLRLNHGWRGRRSMVVLALCFATVFFTYLGMGLLSSAEQSIHGYTSGPS